MATYIVLYNPEAGNGKGEKNAHRLDEILEADELNYIDITTVTDYLSFFRHLSEDDPVILCGGDGTINRFINALIGIPYRNPILYFACGTGNDFLRDLDREKSDKPIDITKYIYDLPLVKVNGKEYRFLNNVGFGIDGYCTQVGDEMRAAGKGNINYAGIAVKGILTGFHPVDAYITVDGKSSFFENVWLAPTMKGRYYGGGMMPTPMQDRASPKHQVSVMIYRTRYKLKALRVFPSIFRGEHTKHADMVDILQGNHIHVVFSRPCPLQIDGETIPDVKEYEVFS